MLRRLMILAVPLLAASAAPAAAQTPLAQACAAFGQVQYRKLDPAVDQVSLLEAADRNFPVIP